jgi:hypothetical protein
MNPDCRWILFYPPSFRITILSPKCDEETEKLVQAELPPSIYAANPLSPVI